MRTRALMARSLEVQEEIREELSLNREDRVQHREEWDRRWSLHRDEVRHELRLTREAIENNREVTRVMIAELRDHGERMREHDERTRVGFDATYGALTDLAAEIRGWQAGEGGADET